MAIFGKKEKKEKEKEEGLTDSERVEHGQVFCRSIIEVLGKPKKHVEDTLKFYVKKIKQDKQIEVIKEEYARTKKQGKLFSIFVEIEFWAKQLTKLIDFCFDYMPSSLEIIIPEKLTYTNDEIAGFLNDLQARLHEFDMMVKTLKTENTSLKNNAGNLMRNIITLSLKSGDKDINALAVAVGVPAEDLKRIIPLILKEKIIIEKGKKYSLRK